MFITKLSGNLRYFNQPLQRWHQTIAYTTVAKSKKVAEFSIKNAADNTPNSITNIDKAKEKRALSLIFGDRKYTELTQKEQALVDTYQEIIQREEGMTLPNTGASLEQGRISKFLECTRKGMNRKE